MKLTTFTVLLCLTMMNLQAQCDSLSADIWYIIKMEKYEKFDSLLMPKEQLRKVMHWPKSDETDKELSIIYDSLKNGLISSARRYRDELINEGFDLEKTKLDSC